MVDVFSIRCIGIRFNQYTSVKVCFSRLDCFFVVAVAVVSVLFVEVNLFLVYTIVFASIDDQIDCRNTPKNDGIHFSFN